MADDRKEPGDILAYSEELLPGHGTYDDGERIRAALYGTEHIDPETMEISIKSPGKQVPSIEKGDVVMGRVSYVKDVLASVEILEVRGKTGHTLLQQVEATLRVAKVDNNYIREMTDVIRVGDIIRAKVIGTRGGPQLATDSPDFGVVKGFSKLDPKRALVREGNRLIDPETGHQETRKFAEDYGSGTL